MQVTVITGSSTGIGRDAALRMSQRGQQVFACVRKESDFPLWEKSPHVKPLLLDVTNQASIQSALARIRPVLEQAKGVNLVNNAGIAIAGPVEAVSVEEWRRQFEVNVFGLIACTQAFLPWIRATRGRLVNISSISGIATSPYLGPYSASKFAVEAISDALRRELRQFGCQVVVIEPGPIATPIWEKGLGKKDSLWNTLEPELRSVYQQELKLFERGVEETVQDAAPVSLVSDAIEKALLHPCPRARYVVGGRSLAMQAKLARLLPDRWMDSLISKRFRPKR